MFGQVFDNMIGAPSDKEWLQRPIKIYVVETVLSHFKLVFDGIIVCFSRFSGLLREELNKEAEKPPLGIIFLNIIYLFSLLEILFDFQPSKWFLQNQSQCIYPVIIGSNFHASLNC